MGVESKIFKNSKKPPRKISNLMKMMNYMLLTVFLLQICIVLLYSALSINWSHQNRMKNYLQIDKSQNVAARFFIQVLTYWVAYSHMIPISLYVLIEMTKLG